MIVIDSISLATRIVEAVGKRLAENKKPDGEVRKRMIIRIAASLEANSLTLGDKVLLDLELRALKSASEIVRQVFSSETGFTPPEEIIPEVFDQRSSLPELAAEFGKRIPSRKRPSPLAISIYDELIEKPDISRAHERDAILLPEYPFDESDPRHIVAVESGADRDKFEKLDDAIARSRFFQSLEKAWKASGKSKEEFRVIVKTHLITMMRRDDVGIYVDPTLVLHLLRRIIEAGFPNVAIAEGRNSFGNWFGHRGVCRVAARAGYLDEDEVRPEGPSPRKCVGYLLASNKLHEFEFIDLGLNTVDYDFKDETLKTHPVNREWIEADYRISFSKFKTHFAAQYALHEVNLSLALAREDKIFHYPKQEDSAKAAVTLIRTFPVHFSFIDGITASDGLLGYTHSPIPRRPGLIIAGQDFIATASLGAQMMGIDPFESLYMREAAKQMGGLTPYKVIGHAPLVRPWRNIRSLWVRFATRLVERFPIYSNFWVSLFMDRADDYFPPKGGKDVLKKREIIRWVTGVRFILFFMVFNDTLAEIVRWITDLRVRRMGERLSLTNSNPEFAEHARRMRMADLRRLRQILDTHGDNLEKGAVSSIRLGHIVRIGETNYPFIGDDALGAISAARIIKGIEQKKWPLSRVTHEIEGWMAVRKALGSRL